MLLDDSRLAAAVRVTPLDRVPQTSWGVVKASYAIEDNGRLTSIPASPLQGDIWTGSESPRWPAGSDYWPFKSNADVVIVGNAYPREGRLERSRDVWVQVGRVRKTARVFGRRRLSWTSTGTPRLGEPEPFEFIELSYRNAYGGVDERVSSGHVSIAEAVNRTGDHPGAYPRNQSGKGYVVWKDRADGVELPQIEDPFHLLTAENILVGHPSNWYLQPLPWFFGWMYPAMFPRAYYVGGRPPFDIPQDVELEEVGRGLIPSHWRTLGVDRLTGGSIPELYYQEASLGMSFADLRSGTPIEAGGMHPDRDTVWLEVPSAPRLEIEVEGDRQVVEAKLMQLVLRPHEAKLDVTWSGIRSTMPRAFFPGIHGKIPITLYVDGLKVPFETPEPVYPRLLQAEADGLLGGRPRPRRPGESLEVTDALVQEGPARRDRDQLHPRAPGTTRIGDADPVVGRVALESDGCVNVGAAPFGRHYSSSMTWRHSALGLGWSHSLEQAVWEQGGWVLYRTEDGRELGVPLPGGELGIGASVHHPNAGFTVLRVAGDAYEVRTSDGKRFGFTKIVESVSTGPEKAKLTRIWQHDGTSLDVRYNTHGRLDRLLLPSGQFVRFEHDQRGKLIRVFAPTRDGREHVVAARYEIDASGQLREAVDGKGRKTTYRYQGRLLTQQTLPSGLVRRFIYDGAGASARCIGEKWDEDEKEREFLYSPDERVTGIVDANGNSFSTRHNPAYLVDRVLDYFANETTREYDEASGLLSSQKTPDGETTYLYDAKFHLADVSAPACGSTALEHDAYGHLEKLTDPDGHTSRWSWDHLGRLAAAIDATGTSVVYDFDGEGPLKGVLTPGDVRVGLERDPQSRAVVRIDAPTGSRHARRDALSRVVAVRDELGQATSLRYDPSGQVAQIERADLVRAYETDAEGRVLSLRDGTTALALERDGLGHLMHVDEGDGGPRLHRDAEGRVTMVESEALDFWELVRDAAGRVIEETGFGDEKRYDLRDHNGLVKRSTRGPHRTTVERDAAGRPTHLEHSDETFQRFAWSPGGRLTHAQEADRMVQLAHDGMGRPTRDAQNEHWVTNQYDASGRRVAVDSSLGLSIRIERDVFGGAMSLAAQRGNQKLELRFDRDATGSEARRHLPGGLSLRWQRDGLGRATERAVMFGERALATLRFHYRGLDRLVRVEDPQRGTRDHRHDARGRLIQQGGVVRALDEVGHVFRDNARDDRRYENGRIVDSGGTAYRYDEAGRRTERETPLGDRHRYRWDTLGRLVEVALSDDRRVVLDYDALGRRVRRRLEEKVDVGLDEPVWEPLRETRYVWDGLELLHEIEGESVTSWIWEAGRLVGLIDDEGAYAVLTDPLGTPTEITDDKGNVVWRGAIDAFGMLQPEATQLKCPWRLPGHYEDPDTGLQHTWLRVYDPEVGAYLTPNPLGVIAGTDLYGYVPDPLSETSPLGLGRGYATLGGELRSERLDAELVDRFVGALDRGDGCAGPRERFDPEAAGWTVPDPEAILWGPWARYRPSENLPPPTATFTRLPETCGLGRR
ncbi:MAG TPA: DUF2169 domain-containing protein [Sandaracinaceae bacterium LLY-WYZ-13_1]|nr:DUF2169 domain-containing protein [Sandaracinaceae bacterium LLY-WYZ-13_1]